MGILSSSILLRIVSESTTLYVLFWTNALLPTKMDMWYCPISGTGHCIENYSLWYIISYVQDSYFNFV